MCCRPWAPASASATMLPMMMFAAPPTVWISGDSTSAPIARITSSQAVSSWTLTIPTTSCTPSASATTAAPPSMPWMQTATPPPLCPPPSPPWFTATPPPIPWMWIRTARAAQALLSMPMPRTTAACWSWPLSSWRARVSSWSPAQPLCPTSRSRPSWITALRKTIPTIVSARIWSAISTPCSSAPSPMSISSLRKASSTPSRASSPPTPPATIRIPPSSIASMFRMKPAASTASPWQATSRSATGSASAAPPAPTRASASWPSPASPSWTRVRP